VTLFFVITFFFMNQREVLRGGTRVRWHVLEWGGSEETCFSTNEKLVGLVALRVFEDEW